MRAQPKYKNKLGFLYKILFNLKDAILGRHIPHPQRPTPLATHF